MEHDTFSAMKTSTRQASMTQVRLGNPLNFNVLLTLRLPFLDCIVCAQAEGTGQTDDQEQVLAAARKAERDRKEAKSQADRLANSVHSHTLLFLCSLGGIPVIGLLRNSSMPI